MTGNSFIRSLTIADDDHDDQLLLKEAIEDFSSPPTINMVSDGNQLIRSLSSGKLPDLILLDLNMPNMNGIECLTQIRSNKAHQHLPVVVLSTSKDIRDIEACFTHGANLFFSKPHTFRDLKSLVHLLLQANWKSFLKIRPDKNTFIRIASEGSLANIPSAL